MHNTKLLNDVNEFVDLVLNQMIFGEDSAYYIGKGGKKITKIYPGFGTGLAGIGFVAEKLLQSKIAMDDERKYKTILFSKKITDNAKLYTKNFFEEFGQAPWAHGFLLSPAGLLIFQGLKSQREENNTVVEDVCETICEFFRSADLNNINPSFYGGLSGLALCLMHVELSNSKLREDIVEIVQNICSHLVKFAKPEHRLNLFVGIEPFYPEIGFSWGLSGIAYALTILKSHPSNPRFAAEEEAAADEIIQYEDQFYNGKTKNWDFFENCKNKMEINHPLTINPYIANSFCYGRVGFLIPRIKRNCFEESENVIQKILSDEKEGIDESFCCGRLSQLEVLRVCSQRQNNAKNNINDISFVKGFSGLINHHLNHAQSSIFKIFK